jgi:hypothetical protein
MKVCVVPYNLLAYVQGGGYAWVYNNWSLGLQANRCDVIWLEGSFYQSDMAAAEVVQRLQSLRASWDAIGLRAGIALILSDTDRERLRSVSEELAELTVPLEAAIVETELLLNFNYSLDGELLGRFRRTALIDVDPGLLQIWISTGGVQPAEHDLYFTIGETVGTPAARFPDCGLRWHYTPPPVSLPAWPLTPADATAPYTTVSNWWGEWVEFGDESYCNDKRASFLEYLDLPSRTAAPLELALCLGEDEDEERHLLENMGWKIRHALDVSSTPEHYRAYIQQSRGEFSCAKPSCMRLSNAWISDRTLCYLASGKPVVVQYTGPSGFLPDGDGLFRFRNPDEATAALCAVESRYAWHCRQARKLAEEHFDAQKVARHVLERALL